MDHNLPPTHLPLTCMLPSLVALITAIQANPNRPIPIIALGLINSVKQNKNMVTAA